MTMAAGKWQQPRKQRPHRRRKQRASGGEDTVSGVRGNIGTTMTATTGDEDYDAGRASVVDDGDWYDDFDHDNNDSSCYDKDNHDDDRRKGGGSGSAKNKADGGGRGQRRQRRQQWQRRGQTTINKEQ